MNQLLLQHRDTVAGTHLKSRTLEEEGNKVQLWCVYVLQYYITCYSWWLTRSIAVTAAGGHNSHNITLHADIVIRGKSWNSI